MNYHLKIKIFSILLLAYFFSSFLSKSVFLGNTPKIRKDLAIYLLKELENQSSILARKIKNQNFNNTNLSSNRHDIIKNKDIGAISMKNRVIPLSKSVYAEVENNVVTIKIDEKGIEWVERTYDLNGKVIIIKIPRDSLPPSEDIINELYSK